MGEEVVGEAGPLPPRLHRHYLSLLERCYELILSEYGSTLVGEGEVIAEGPEPLVIELDLVLGHDASNDYLARLEAGNSAARQGLRDSDLPRRIERRRSVERRMRTHSVEALPPEWRPPE